MTYIKAGDKEWFRSSLGKSAFTSKIYRGLPLDYYLPGIEATVTSYKIAARHNHIRLFPKFYMLHDSFLMFYQPADVVSSSIKKNPKRKSAWWRIVRTTITSKEWLELNKVTSNSQELAALAAAQFLAKLLRATADAMEAAKVRNYSTATEFLDKASDSEAEQLFSKGGGASLAEVISSIAKDVKEAVKEYSEAREEAEEALQVLSGSGGYGYNHEALSVLKYLQRPDEFRKRVNIIRWAAIMLKQFTSILPTSITHEQAVSEVGGVVGITKMLRESQLKDIRPEELAALASSNPIAKLYLAVRIAQKQALVTQRAATVKPVIFVDKSGSMAAPFDYAEDVPKISAAAGLALAIYRKLQGEVYLFDTEVEKVPPRKIVETLLTISADGGTSITEVFQEILRIGRRDYVYIIITDAIEYPDENVITELKRRGLAARIRFILTPPAWEEVWLTRNFKYWKAEDIASFMRAARQALQ